MVALPGGSGVAAGWRSTHWGPSRLVARRRSRVRWPHPAVAAAGATTAEPRAALLPGGQAISVRGGRLVVALRRLGRQACRAARRGTIMPVLARKTALVCALAPPAVFRRTWQALHGRRCMVVAPHMCPVLSQPPRARPIIPHCSPLVYRVPPSPASAPLSLVARATICRPEFCKGEEFKIRLRQHAVARFACPVYIGKSRI